MVDELFSARLFGAGGPGGPDVLQYDDLPKAFRTQVNHLLKGTIGRYDLSVHLGSSFPSVTNRWWKKLYSAFVREKGVSWLTPGIESPLVQCIQYISEAATLDALDLIEFAFKFINTEMRDAAPYVRMELSHLDLIQPDAAISELNRRFRQHRLGYDFTAGELIKINSRYIHAEVLRPALQLLQDAGADFSGPLDEFLKAHEHHRQGNLKDAISWALKALESTLKAICIARGWPFDPQKDTAKQLLDIVYAGELVPSYLQQHMGGLRSALEAGVPTIRNKNSGHGQGAMPIAVPDHYVKFALHLAAADIVFLIEAHKVKP
jgi:AbiJ N-terminal domain 4